MAAPGRGRRGGKSPSGSLQPARAVRRTSSPPKRLRVHTRPALTVCQRRLAPLRSAPCCTWARSRCSCWRLRLGEFRGRGRLRQPQSATSSWPRLLKARPRPRRCSGLTHAAEFVFRGVCVALLQQKGWSRRRTVLLCPLFFGVAHVHHCWDLVVVRKLPVPVALGSVGLQLAYSTLFGASGARKHSPPVAHAPATRPYAQARSPPCCLCRRGRSLRPWQLTCSATPAGSPPSRASGATAARSVLFFSAALRRLRTPRCLCGQGRHSCRVDADSPSRVLDLWLELVDAVSGINPSPALRCHG